MTLRELHAAGAWFVVVGNGLAGVWAMGAHRAPSLRRPALWWLTGVAEVGILVQAVLGVALLNAEDIDPPRFHMFYGFVAIIAAALIYSYRQSVGVRLYLLYGLGGLFLMGLGIRAMVIGPGR